MRRFLASAVLLGVFAASARAHFVFVVPAADGKTASVVFSEGLEPDGDVEVTTIGQTKLSARDADGKDHPTSLKSAEHAFEVAIGPQTAVLHGTCEYGVMTRGGSKPFLLVYHPKTIVGDAFAEATRLGDTEPVEIVAIGKPGDVRFQVVANGKPVAESEVTIIAPDGAQTKVKTDANGQTPSYSAHGRYGVWARYVVATGGKHQDESYEEIRRYPSLVVDIENKLSSPVTSFTSLPYATSSFGAVACDGWLYVYGGHIARTHSYSTEAVSSRLHRLRLEDGKTWEELPGGPGVQGMNLATHGGKVYRVGGMEPRNKPDEEVDNHSIPNCDVFDPATKTWSAMTPLPVPRSSHDVAVVGDQLFVIGGWNMKGEAGNDWLDNMFVADLTSEKPEWRSIKQPFERRALIVAVHRNKIYMIGGFDEDDEPSHRVDIYDTATGVWTTGPELPGGRMNGFAPAACVLDDHVYASVADGALYRLNEAAGQWEEVARTTPRIVHRLIPHDGKILVLGGAAKGDNLSLVEAVTIASPKQP